MAHSLSLDPFPMKIVLVIGKDDWKKLAEENDLDDRTWLDENSGGEVSHSGDQIVVRLRDDVTHEHIDILAHESTHCFQAMCAYIQEEQPSNEFEAYHIGFITKWIYDTLKELKCPSSSPTGDNSPSSEPSSPSVEPSGSTLPVTDEPKQP